MTFRSSGSGPGVQAPDGCSVDLYRITPYHGELEDFGTLFPAGTRVLELGCGAGRFTRRLLDWGARVTAVDNSQHMLAEVPDGAARVLSDIESLNLDESFDVALLAGNFINAPEPEVRSAFVRSARRHVRKDGRLLLDRHDPAWLRSAEPGPLGAAGDIAMCVEAVSRVADIVQMTLRYEAAGRIWRHSFAATALSEGDIEALLARFGFVSFEWSGSRNQWLSAVVRG
jgi:SAM-dependent methyltransferase